MPGVPTILLIDGRKEDRQYWTERLHIAAPHYVVLEADSGASGLAICQSQHVDCVVTELDLPDMSGFQVLINLVRYPEHPERAVIFLTHLGSLLALDDLARRNGALAYLTKSHASGDILATAIRDTLTAISLRPQ